MKTKGHLVYKFFHCSDIVTEAGHLRVTYLHMRGLLPGGWWPCGWKGIQFVDYINTLQLKYFEFTYFIFNLLVQLSCRL